MYTALKFRVCALRSYFQPCNKVLYSSIWSDGPVIYHWIFLLKYTQPFIGGKGGYIWNYRLQLYVVWIPWLDLHWDVVLDDRDACMNTISRRTWRPFKFWFRDPLQVFSRISQRRLPWTSTTLKFVQIHEVSSLCSSRTREIFYTETVAASIGLTTKVVHHELICQYPKLALWRCYENPGMLFSHTVVLDITLSLYYQRDCIYLGCICIEAISNLSELRSILTEVLIMRLTSVLTEWWTWKG